MTVYYHIAMLVVFRKLTELRSDAKFDTVQSRTINNDDYVEAFRENSYRLDKNQAKLNQLVFTFTLKHVERSTLTR